ncbi:hypothetical protein [Streptomyces sp. NPDC001380]|uniref:hypothetical protein n=1 Tax=Streptomyces sp. NPDC001380 TaxID=3364566 RepID=UPI003692290A
MIWDVLLLRLPDDAASVQDVPKGYASPPLGRLQDVLAIVRQVLPEADLSDPAWGELVGPTWSLGLNIGWRDPVDSVMLHIRGSGDDVLVPVFRLADALGCRVLDFAEGDLITPRQSSGWHAFQEFRDRVTGPAD